VAAFDHGTIFLDPTRSDVLVCGTARVFDCRARRGRLRHVADQRGRRRLPRTAKSIPVTPQVRDALDLGDAASVSPAS